MQLAVTARRPSRPKRRPKYIIASGTGDLWTSEEPERRICRQSERRWRKLADGARHCGRGIVKTPARPIVRVLLSTSTSTSANNGKTDFNTMHAEQRDRRSALRSVRFRTTGSHSRKGSVC
ncbi:hypothetical protein AJ87_22375 [Rhizobium yanglingense]|nr:hypothetical protein AJ87_22375 [Rhizobium yanglingense]